MYRCGLTMCLWVYRLCELRCWLHLLLDSTCRCSSIASPDSSTCLYRSPISRRRPGFCCLHCVELQCIKISSAHCSAPPVATLALQVRKHHMLIHQPSCSSINLHAHPSTFKVKNLTLSSQQIELARNTHARNTHTRNTHARNTHARNLEHVCTYVQRFSGYLTKIRSRNWCMCVSMAHGNKVCTWSPSQSTVCSSLDRCRAYLRAGRLHVNGEGTYCASSRQCTCAKILNGFWSSNLKTSVHHENRYLIQSCTLSYCCKLLIWITQFEVWITNYYILSYPVYQNKCEL